ncbi:MAG: signal peptidase I [Bacilli bacterium]|nr:signal peptidase I [Bacilli bacterium]
MDDVNTMITGASAVVYIIALAVGIFQLVCMWMTFKKAGRQGWAAIIPIFNVIVELDIAHIPVWMILLYIIPIANIFMCIYVPIKFAKAFGKGILTALLLMFVAPIGWALLAFGDAKYQG